MYSCIKGFYIGKHLYNLKIKLIVFSIKELLEIDKNWIGKTIWYDEHLYREGAMNVADIEMIIRKWEKRGLKLLEEVDGKKVFKDLCAVDVGRGPP